jgi:hypothetical protein
MPVRHQAEVADALKARRKSVNQKPADELFHIQSHRPGLVAVLAAIVLPLERYPAVGKAENAIVGQGYAVGVAAQILNRRKRSSKRLLRIDNPFGFSNRIEISLKPQLVFERLQFAEEPELVSLKRFFQSTEKVLISQAGRNRREQENVEPPD